jgi:CheY-like chemotaxis protein
MVEVGESAAGPRVLVIDDEVDSRLLLSDAFSDLGCRVSTAPSVVEGARLAREITPDLITLDLMMPGLDGWEGLRLLKSDPTLEEIPVVVISIVGGDHRRSLVGAADVLEKPVDRRTLDRVLGDHLPAVGSRVFVVDAGGAGRDTQRVLESDGLEVAMAPISDGVHEAISQFDPELVVLALREPGPASIAFLERIHLLPGFADMPVVVLGAGPEVSDLERVSAHVSAVLHEEADLGVALRRALRQTLWVAA